MKSIREKKYYTSADSDNLNIDLFPSKTKIIRDSTKSDKTSLKSQDALEAAIGIIVHIFDADGCSLFLFNSERECLELAVTFGIKPAEIRIPRIVPGKGISGLVFKNGKSLLSNDVKNDDRFDKVSELEFIVDTYKIIAAPLILRRKCMGVVEILNKPCSHDFTLTEMKLLKAISKKIAILVENEQLFDRCCLKLIQRNTMLDLAREVNTARELPDLLNFIVITAAELLDSEGSSLLLRKGDVLRFEIVFGEKGTQLMEYTVPLGAGIAGSVALSGKSTIVNQADLENSGIYRDIDKKSGFNTRNLLCVPLRVKERIIGVVEVVNRREKEDFSEDDISLLEGFANEAAIAIERAQLMEERIQSERLATVGRTVAGLAHFIKNIANALKAGEYIVDKGLRDNNTELMNKGWKITKKGSERIRNLVLDMLTISKKREPEVTICLPHEIIKEVKDVIADKAKEKDVKIETQFDEKIGQVRIDRKNIFRCLMNLVSNSMDACKEHEGIIKIETFKVKEKPFFGYRVIDNGQGISKENQKKLFHDFFSTKGSQGTGLGLSVTHAIVSEHDGNIRCDSQYGIGTAFTIELPIGL
jgi:signal transduction histidine kinase